MADRLGTPFMHAQGLTSVRLLTMLDLSLGAEVAEWQTRRTQNPVG